MGRDDATHNNVISRTIASVVAGDILQLGVDGISQQHPHVRARIDAEIAREGCRVERRGRGWVIRIECGVRPSGGRSTLLWKRANLRKE